MTAMETIPARTPERKAVPRETRLMDPSTDAVVIFLDLPAAPKGSDGDYSLREIIRGRSFRLPFELEGLEEATACVIEVYQSHVFSLDYALGELHTLLLHTTNEYVEV